MRLGAVQVAKASVRDVACLWGRLGDTV